MHKVMPGVAQLVSSCTVLPYSVLWRVSSPSGSCCSCSLPKRTHHMPTRTFCFLLATRCSISTPERPRQFPHRLLHASSAYGGWAMTFEEILDQAIAMLQRRGRMTYRTLQRQFALDDAALEDLTNELIKGQRLARDEDGEVLVWIGVAIPPPAPAPTPPPLAYTPPYLVEKILTTGSALEGERKQ